jgi:hypothetical protein
MGKYQQEKSAEAKTLKAKALIKCWNQLKKNIKEV